MRTLLISLLAAVFVGLLSVPFVNILAHEPLEVREDGLLKRPPYCEVGGEEIFYRPADTKVLWRQGISFAFAGIDPMTGKRQIVFDDWILSQAPPEFQRFVFAHECEHHKLGHTDEWFAAHGMSAPNDHDTSYLHNNEKEADCSAIRRLRDEDNFTDEQFEVLFNKIEDHEFTFLAGWGVSRSERIQASHTWTLEQRLEHIKACRADKYAYGQDQVETHTN